MLLINILCAVIAAAATIICALIAANHSKSEKQRQESAIKEEARSRQRAKEGRLQLAMIAANSELTVGVAIALKKGQCNGEVEAGLRAVQEANRKYKDFLETVAMEHINGEVE